MKKPSRRRANNKKNADRKLEAKKQQEAERKALDAQISAKEAEASKNPETSISPSDADILKNALPALCALRGRRTAKTGVIIERLSRRYYAGYISSGKSPDEALRLTVGRITKEYTEV